MTVYVDNPRLPFGRMLMAHMMSEDLVELHAMASEIGIARRHFQGDHYDVCLAKRALAIEHGAVEVTSRDLVRLRRSWR